MLSVQFINCYFYIYLHIWEDNTFIHQWFYSRFIGPWPLFQIRNSIHSRKDSLDGGSARLKVATYTQNSTNTDIHVSSVIWTHDPSVRATVIGIWEDNTFQTLYEAVIASIITSEHCYWPCWSFEGFTLAAPCRKKQWQYQREQGRSTRISVSTSINLEEDVQCLKWLSSLLVGVSAH
jgi:hypothetical protein